MHHSAVTLAANAACLQVLKQKKMYEQQIGNMMNQQFNVEQTRFHVENMQTNITVVQSMKAANKEMKTVRRPGRMRLTSAIGVTALHARTDGGAVRPFVPMLAFECSSLPSAGNMRRPVATTGKLPIAPPHSCSSAASRQSFPAQRLCFSPPGAGHQKDQGAEPQLHRQPHGRHERHGGERRVARDAASLLQLCCVRGASVTGWGGCPAVHHFTLFSGLVAFYLSQ